MQKKIKDFLTRKKSIQSEYIYFDKVNKYSPPYHYAPFLPTEFEEMKFKAIVYSENQFGENDGKVANGLVRHSEKYEIIGVIDSTKSGQDAGYVLDGVSNKIPIFLNLESALETLSDRPDYFIYGIAPTHPILNKKERQTFFDAMKNGLNIVNGLPEFFSEDSEFIEHAAKYSVTITDVRKPPSRNQLHSFTGEIYDISVPIVAILGTDCAVGKRTTAQKLVKELRKEGINVVFIATGQTGLLQGAKYGAAIDMLSSGHATGAVENAIIKAVTHEHPDIIIVEGQGSLGHPAYTSSAAILKGSLPNAIIVQHSPMRKNYCTYPEIELNPLQSEIDLIEEFAGPYVVAITLNHEHMTEMELHTTIEEYEETYGLPVTDVLINGCDKLLDKILDLFPELRVSV